MRHTCNHEIVDGSSVLRFTPIVVIARPHFVLRHGLRVDPHLRERHRFAVLEHVVLGLRASADHRALMTVPDERVGDDLVERVDVAVVPDVPPPRDQGSVIGHGAQCTNSVARRQGGGLNRSWRR